MSGHETSHGKVRLTGARVSDHADHADGANAVDRSADHDESGRFRKGNAAAKGTGSKRTIRMLVPKRGAHLFEDLTRQLGASGGTLAYMHAADTVNHQIDALELGELARAAGLGTTEGQLLHARAQKSSELALRSATAALETARLFKRPRATRKANVSPPGFEDGP